MNQLPLCPSLGTAALSIRERIGEEQRERPLVYRGVRPGGAKKRGNLERKRRRRKRRRAMDKRITGVVEVGAK